MKISYPQLSAHLANKLHPFYFICTDDILQALDAASDIRNKARAQGFAERVLTTIDVHTDVEEILYADTHALSLFESKKIVEFNFQQCTLKSAQGKILDEYA